MHWGIKNNFDFYRCAACAYTFTPLREIPAAIYDKDYFRGATRGFGYVDYDSDKASMGPTFETYLNIIERFTPGRNLLDVGAATGYFLQIAAERRWKTEGIEISDYAAGVARANGLKVATGTLDTLTFPEHSFDAITFWDVIEHIPNPLKTLELTSKLLKSGGVLAVNTPDGESMLARILKTRWHLVVPPEHLQFFSPNNFKKILEPLGFETVAVKKIGKKFTLPYTINFLGNWIHSNALKKLAANIQKTRFSHVGLPINLCDNFFLIAKKA